MALLFDKVLGIEVASDGETFATTEGGRVYGRGTRPFCERRRLELLLARHGEGKPNLTFPTMGGTQLWADVFVHAGWRVQENALLDLHRLLDAHNTRQAWGTYEECRTVFERERLARGLRTRSTHAVVFVHGLARSRASLRRLSDGFSAAGYEVASVSYPSTRGTIDHHAHQLSRVMARMREVETVSFVTHSLGALIVRAMLATERSSQWRTRIALDRILMIFPPSRGAAIAAAWKDTTLARLVMGPPLSELAGEEVLGIPEPPCPFGIIAGTKDRKVTLDEAWLAGCEHFLPLPVGHTFGMMRPMLIESAVRYIDRGERGEGSPTQ
jgi:pimeloyl-ACP methyl ester carboxylesterase